MTERIDKPLTADIAEESIWILREKISENECYFAEHDRYPKGVESDYQNALYVAIEALEKQATGEWISCSKKLPPKPKENPMLENKPLEMYLVSVSCGEYPFRAFWNGKFFTDGLSRCDVIAWMPLPKPFQEGEL